MHEFILFIKGILFNEYETSSSSLVGLKHIEDDNWCILNTLPLQNPFIQPVVTSKADKVHVTFIYKYIYFHIYVYLAILYSCMCSLWVNVGDSWFRIAIRRSLHFQFKEATIPRGKIRQMGVKGILRYYLCLLKIPLFILKTLDILFSWKSFLVG